MQSNRQEYEQRKEWARQEREDHFRVAAGMMEFMGVVLGIVVILVMLALLFSLVSWLMQDIESISTIFHSWFK